MNVFSKLSKNQSNHITYIEYYNKNIDLTKYKIPELKTISKYNGLHVSGTKKVLINRIETHFKNSKYAIKIQSLYRRHLVTVLFKIHRPAFKQRQKCVNDTDFYTMDPLDEIDLYSFFSFEDEAGFLYGFHIQSLISMIQKSCSAKNPYTRELLNGDILENILTFYRISNILLSNFNIQNLKHDGDIAENRVLHSPNSYTSIIENIHIGMSQQNHQQPNYTNTRNQTLQYIEELRRKDITTRINEVFIEIDLLGNYTQSSWFSNLNMYSYVAFIQNLYGIWNQRSNMSIHIRSQICPYYNPFNYQIDTTNVFASYNMNLINLKNCALTIMENIVFSGGDLEYRKIGVMHLLTALTIVSVPARENLPWLYESMAL